MTNFMNSFRFAGGGVLWTPNDLPTPPIWWTEIGTVRQNLVLVGGNFIDSYLDVNAPPSPSPGHPYFTRRSSRADIISDPNDGRVYARHDSDVYDGNSHALADFQTPFYDFFICCNLRGRDTTRQSWRVPNGPGFQCWMEHRETGNTRGCFRRKSSGGNLFFNWNTSSPDFDWMILSRHLDSTTELGTAYYNGNLVYTSPVQVEQFSGAANMPFGGRSNGTFWQGGFRCEMLFNYNLGTANRQRVEGYLAWNFSDPNYLPIGHPYRNNPPTV